MRYLGTEQLCNLPELDTVRGKGMSQDRRKQSWKPENGFESETTEREGGMGWYKHIRRPEELQNTEFSTARPGVSQT